MLKLTLKNFFLLLVVTYAQGNSFIIKLASYTDKASLMQQVTHLDLSIQKHIVLVKEDKLYKLFGQTFNTREDGLKYLPLYQKVFSDAFIMVDTYTKKEKQSMTLLSSLQEETHNTQILNQPIKPNNTLMQPSIDKEQSLSLQEILQDKTFYLCPQNIHTLSEKLLIEANFTKDTVSYKTLLGNIPSMKNRYTVRKNKLYLINNNAISISQYSTVDTILFEYILVSRWFKGKKIHQMRYYKKEADARSYIDSIELH